MYAQTEEDVANGLLRIQLGDDEKKLRVLTLEQSEEWLEVVRVKGGAAYGQAEHSNDPLGLLGLASGTLIELVAAYDRDHVLGTAVELKRALSRAQLVAVAKAIVRAEFPFESEITQVLEHLKPLVPTVVSAMGASMERFIAKLGSPSSTSSGSPNGVAPPPTPSGAISPEASSSSSGGAGKSGSPGRRKSSPN